MKKKRTKRSRLRGRRTCGYGSRKKHRGKGSKGGKGMAGSGKKAGQLKTYLLRYEPDYLGKRGFTSLKKLKRKIKGINLSEIQEHKDKFLKKGLAKEGPEGIELELRNYKILSRGNLKDKFIIKAASFSKKAEEKIKKVGGEISII